MLRSSLVILALLPLACTGSGSDDTGGDSSSSAGGNTNTDTSADDDSTGGVMIDVPTEGVALLAWLEAETYTSWEAETAVHDATGTSPHGRVRTYFNDVLVTSYMAGNTTHGVGSAAVKELFDGMDARIGWAVGVKVAESDAPESWYWYLNAGGMVNADGTGVALCEDCHVAGTDRMITGYPLQ